MKKITQNFVTLFSVNFLTKGVSFLLLPIYLNLMTPEEFGNYSYIMTIVGLISFIYSFGQHTTINRFYHSREYTKDELIENIQLIIVTAFIVFSIFLIYLKSYLWNIFFSSSINIKIFYSMLALSMLIALNQIIMSILYQSQNIKVFQKKSIIEFLVFNLLSLSFLFYLPYPKDELRILAMLFGYSIIIAIYYRFFIRKYNFKFKSRSLELYKRSFLNGFPVAIGSCSNFLINLGDRMIIEKLLENYWLGIFSFAVSVVNILMLIFYSFQSAWLPYFFKEKNLNLSLQRTYKIIFIFFILSIILGILFYIIIDILANNFIDHIYLKSLHFLWLLILASFFQIAGMMMTGFYQIYEKNHIAVPVNTFAGIINILMNYYLIKIFGVAGAALSTALTSISLFIVHFCLVKFYSTRGSYGEYFTITKNN